MKLKNLDSKMRVSRKTVNNCVDNYVKAAENKLLFYIYQYCNCDFNNVNWNLTKKEQKEILWQQINDFNSVRDFINYVLKSMDLFRFGWSADGVNDLEI